MNIENINSIYLKMLTESSEQYIITFHPINNEKEIEPIGTFSSFEEAQDYLNKEIENNIKGFNLQDKNIQKTDHSCFIQGFGEYFIDQLNDNNSIKNDFLKIVEELVAETYRLGFDSGKNNTLSNPLKDEQISNLLGSIERMYDEK